MMRFLTYPVNIPVLIGTRSGTVQRWKVVPVRYRCIRYKVPIRYLSIHVLHTVPVPYTSTGLVPGSSTAGTDSLCNGTINGITFVPGQYRFCTGSVSLLYWVSIAFVPGQYHFCTGSMLFLYTITVSFTYCFCTSLHKLMSCMHTWHLSL